ncbi:MAG: cyclophilin-like family protein [Pelagibacteraceae bacterium]
MKLLVNNKTINISLLDTKTARIISKSMEFSSLISTWGDEIYFKTPIKGIKLEENARDTMDFGEIAYWVEGNSIAIGFGITPASINDEIRLVSKVNIWAKFNTKENDINFFKSIKDDTIIKFIN